MLPSISKIAQPGSETEEEIDNSFAGISGVSNHMTCDQSLMSNIKETRIRLEINLPNGKTAMITHTRTVKLENNLKLENVLCVPKFRHNMLFVNKQAYTANQV